MTADARTSWGTWGSWSSCSNRGYVVAFHLLIKPYTVLSDNSALNGIGLLCNDNTWKTSSVGQHGYWNIPLYCSAGKYIVGFRLNSQNGISNQELNYFKFNYLYSLIGRDNYGATDLQMVCNDGRVLSYSSRLSLAYLGVWGNWFNCSVGHICEIRALVDSSIVNSLTFFQKLDYTGLNSVQFTCCFP